MTNTKLFDYLQSMSAYELNRLAKFVQREGSSNPLTAELVDVCLLHFKNHTSDLLTAKHLWKQIFKAKKFHAQTFNRLLSDTVKAVETFWIEEQIQSNQTAKNILLLEQLNARKLDKHFPELHRFTVAKHRQTPIKNSEFYLHEIKLNELQNAFIENRNERSNDKNLPEISAALDAYYFLQKLKYYAAALHYGSFLSGTEESPLMQEIIAETSKPLYAKHIHLQAYRTIALTFLEPDEEKHFNDLKTFIRTGDQLFPFAELQSFYVFAVNYCIRKINLGDADYLHRLFDLYQYALKANFLLDDQGALSQWDFKNIVTTALRVKQHQWTRQFLEEYKNTLPAEDRQNAYTFNLARYHFAVKDYNSVLSLLQQVEYNDIFYQLDAKTTLLKTYYEKGEALPVHSLKDSFRVLLQRKKLISEQQKQNYLNLLKFTIRLHKADVRNKKAMQQLSDEINATPNIADKSWLVEKLNELT